MNEPTAERLPDSTCFRFGHGIEVVLADAGEVGVYLGAAYDDVVLALVNNGPSTSDRAATAQDVAKSLAAFTDELTKVRLWLLGSINTGAFREYRSVPGQT